MKKASDCDECRHSQWRIFWHKGQRVDDLKCHKGHKPRFYKMTSPIDNNWGFKRVCEDFDDGKK